MFRIRILASQEKTLPRMVRALRFGTTPLSTMATSPACIAIGTLYFVWSLAQLPT